LVFVAADAARYSELELAVRQHLAWTSICKDVDAAKLDLDNSNREQARASVNKTASDVMVKLGEVVSFVLVPYQPDPRGAMQWEVVKVAGAVEQLSTRVVKKLESDEHLTRKLGGIVLRKDVDRVPLWRDGKHVSVAQLQEDFSRYVYLPRLLSDQALFGAIREGTNLLNGDDGFAYAEGYDEPTGNYTRLRFGLMTEETRALTGWLVKPEVALPIIDAEAAKADIGTNVVRESVGPSIDRDGFDRFWGTGSAKSEGGTTAKAEKRRFHGTIRLKHADFRERAGDLSREVAQQLAKVVGSEVEIVVEVIAEADGGFSEDVRRAVSENCRTLKFDSFDFEDE
jgi:hypothetical protein